MPVYPTNGGSTTSVIETTWTITGLNQANYIPVEGCAAPPVGCFLEITGSSHTDVTIRGAADGTITVGISGQTGTTTWYLDGVFVASGITEATSSYQFTGLAAGTYDVQVEDSHSPDVCFASVQDITILDGEFRSGNFQLSYPDVLVALENPVIVGVETAITNPNPRQNITTLDIDGTINDGDSITFNLTSPFLYSQTFYAKAYPNKPNFFLASVLNNSTGTPVGTNTTTEIATSLAEALQLDAVIPKVYYINNSGSIVTLAAKETGTKFNLDTTNVIISGDVELVQTQVPTNYCDGQITDNYSISCEVMVNTDSTNQYPDVGQTTDYNRVAELILPFNPSNVHRFDIGSILKSQVSTPMPDMTLTGSTMLPTVMQPYYVRLSELYPLVANTNTVKKRYKTSVPVNWVINSSLDRNADNTMEDYLGHYYNNINPNWTYTAVGIGSYPYYSGHDVTFEDVLFDTGDTGTTNVQISVWNYNNTSQVESWRAYTSGFNGLSSGTYYGRVSGSTDGITFMFSRYFYVNPYATGQTNTQYPSANHDVLFLTNSPSVKQIQRASNEFLYFVLPKNYGYDLVMKGDLYFYDGTEELSQTFFTISTGDTNAGGCIIMNLSYDKLGLAAYEVSGTTNRKIKRMELAVWQSNAYGDFQYTETKTYRFEIDEMPRKAGILFQNALGMYDAFDFIGEVEETISRDNDTYTVPLSFASTGSLQYGFKNTATYNTKIVKKVVVNSGWIDEAHFDWLMELMKSNNIYSTSTTNQNYLNLVGYDYNKSSLDDLFNIEAEFEWTIYENNITV